MLRKSHALTVRPSRRATFRCDRWIATKASMINFVRRRPKAETRRGGSRIYSR
jgi:hypothetical protein